MSQEGFDLLKANCINTGLCVECGGCAVVCPNNAIELKRYSWGRNPELIAACPDSQCTACHDVCPSRDVPVSRIEETFFGRTADMDTLEAEVGVVRNVYTGQSLSQDIHDQAVAGGVVTSILAHALETGRIDGAVTAGFDPEKPWVGKAKVAQTREELIGCAGSCYQPHPQLLGLSEVVKMGLEKIAITATPCHAAAIRKMMLRPEFSDIAGRIKYVFCNFCAAHWSLHATEHLITEKLGVQLEDVARLKYRARPFPGYFKVWLKDGTTRENKFVYGFLNDMGKFTPEDCRVCLDKVAYSGDLAFGDTWSHPKLRPGLLSHYSDDELAADERIDRAKKGMTAILARSERGDELLNSAAEAGAIKIYPEERDVGLRFLADVQAGKRGYNGPVVEARKRRGIPIRRYVRD